MLENKILGIVESVSPISLLKALYAPIHSKRMVDAQAYEIKTISRVIKECDIDIIYDSGNIKITSTTTENATSSSDESKEEK
jgi:hypothetical protein